MSLPDDREQSYHMYWMLLPSLAARTTLIAYLRELGIYAPFHYLPLHLSDMGRKFGGVEGDCPVTENVSDRLIRLPLYNAMTEDEQMRVIAALFAFEGW
jgi:dTDP-4-amino-4,6-dideoxygalactose transaminase